MKLKNMRLSAILLFIFLSSCTVRSYDVNFYYYVGNNEFSEKLTKKDIEFIKKTTDDLKKQTINIPSGSGNLTIYIAADVPKHIETSADLDASIPLVGK